MLDAMPVGKPRIAVKGKCTFPTPGYKVVLEPHHPPRTSPKILVLEKIVTAPAGIEPQVITTIEVRFGQETDEIYSEVEILPDGMRIKVQVVS